MITPFSNSSLHQCLICFFSRLIFFFVSLQEKFVLANKAYDFLCSRNSWLDNGPNPNNIVLILQTQSILFGRYSSGKNIRLSYCIFNIMLIFYHLFSLHQNNSSILIFCQNIKRMHFIYLLFTFYFFLQIGIYFMFHPVINNIQSVICCVFLSKETVVQFLFRQNPFM